MAFPRIVNDKAIHLTAHASPLLFAFTGMGQPFSTPINKPFGRTLPLNGLNHRVRYLTEVEPITAIASNAASVAPRQPTTNDDAYSAYDVTATRYVKHWWITNRDLLRMQGDRAIQQGMKYSQEKIREISQAWVKLFGEGFYANQAQDPNGVGGLRYWIDDDNTIGVGSNTVDRTLAANADLRSYVDDTAEALTLAKIFTADSEIGVHAAVTDAAFLGKAQFVKLNTLLEGKFTMNTITGGMMKFGGRKLVYMDIPFVLDYYAPANKIFGLHFDSWELGMDKQGIGASDWYSDHSTEDALALDTSCNCCLVCTDPRKNWLIEALT